MPNMAAIVHKHIKIALQNRADPSPMPHHTHRVIGGIKPTALWKENAAKAPLHTKLH